MMRSTWQSRDKWTIVLAAAALGVAVAVGVLVESAWATVELAAFFLIIMLLGAVVRDHGWGGLGLGALKVVGVVGCVVLFAMGFAGGGYIFVFIAMFGALLYVIYWVAGRVRIPRSKVTASALLPPQWKARGGGGRDDNRDVTG